MEPIDIPSPPSFISPIATPYPPCVVMSPTFNEENWSPHIWVYDSILPISTQLSTILLESLPHLTLPPAFIAGPLVVVIGPIDIALNYCSLGVHFSSSSLNCSSKYAVILLIVTQLEFIN